MIQTEYRAPDSLDFEAMLKHCGSLPRNLAVAIAISLAIALLIHLVSKTWITPMAVGVGFFATSFVSSWQFFGEISRKRKLANDVGAVEVIHVDASRIFDIVAQGSNGPALVFFVDAETALILVGQWLNEFRPFPVHQFKIHVWTKTREPIRIESSGKRAKTEESPVTLLSNYRLGKMELFGATPDTLQQDLDNAFGRGTQ